MVHLCEVNAWGVSGSGLKSSKRGRAACGERGLDGNCKSRSR